MLLPFSPVVQSCQIAEYCKTYRDAEHCQRDEYCMAFPGCQPLVRMPSHTWVWKAGRAGVRVSNIIWRRHAAEACQDAERCQGAGICNSQQYGEYRQGVEYCTATPGCQCKVRMPSDARRREIVIVGRMVSITEVLHILRRHQTTKAISGCGKFEGTPGC